MQSLKSRELGLRGQQQGHIVAQPSMLVVHVSRPCPRQLAAANRSSNPASCSGSSSALAGRPRRSRVQATPSFMSLPSLEGYVEVDAVKGMRITMDGDKPVPEFLVKWKASSFSTRPDAPLHCCSTI